MKSFLILLSSLTVPIFAGILKGEDTRHADREIMNIHEIQVKCPELWFASNSSEIHRLRLSGTQGFELIVELNYPVVHDVFSQQQKIIGDSIVMKQPKVLKLKMR